MCTSTETTREQVSTNKWLKFIVLSVFWPCSFPRTTVGLSRSLHKRGATLRHGPRTPSGRARTHSRRSVPAVPLLARRRSAPLQAARPAPIPASRISARLALPAAKGLGQRGRNRKLFPPFSPASPRPAPPRLARPRSQKGIVGPPWPPPEPSGAEARAVLLLGPDRAGPRTFRTRLRVAVGAVPGPGACRGACFREVLPAGSRNTAGEAEESGGFAFCRAFAFVGPGAGVRPRLWAGRSDCEGTRGRVCVPRAPPLRSVFGPQSKASDLEGRLERLSAFFEVTQPVRERLLVIR